MRKLIFLVLFMNAAQLMGQNYRVVVDSNGYDCTFRGLCAVSEDIAWACGSKGTVAKTINGGKRWEFYKILDTAISEIRDIEAWDANQAVVLSVKGPAEILKTTDGGQSWKSVFKSTNPNSFLDGMAFWNKDRGIAFGDPIDGHFEIITTHDGGNTWQQLPQAHAPRATKEEAAFAASGTSITVGENGWAWFVTGGNASHLFISSDYGNTWKHHETHMTHGSDSKGINSVVFGNSLHGVAVGGDYMQPTLSELNYSVTTDGGATWHTDHKTNPPNGYKSCVEHLTGSTYITVGKNGIDISTDGGYHWTTISLEYFIVIDKSPDNKAIYLCGSRVLGRLILVD